MLSIAIDGDAEVDGALAGAPARVQQAVAAEVAALTAELLARVQAKLSGEVLAVRSGRLRQSVFAEIDADGGDPVGRVGVDPAVPYAAILEFGGRTAAHEIAARKAQALHFVAGGKAVFARRVQHPGSKIPEHSYLRSALRESADEIRDRLRQAVRDASADMRP